MNVHHIFIFTDQHTTAAEELLHFGLLEGSSRSHPGQGTRNRKFYFENFYLEILWVHDQQEIMSERTKESGLWQRAGLKNKDFSPFGLCLVNEDETEKLFEHAFPYQPEFFPPGHSIAVLKNEQQPGLPWTFQLPFKGNTDHSAEPAEHPNGIRRLTKTLFEYRGPQQDNFTEHFTGEKGIEFRSSPRNWLTLTFDEAKQNRRTDFETLQLTIES